IPAWRGKTYAVGFGGFAIQTAAFQVVDRHVFAGMLTQLRLIEIVRFAQQGVNAALFFFPLSLRFALYLSRHFQTCQASELFNRLGKAEPLVIHDKADGITVCAAAKAVKKLFIRANRKGGRLFVVEGAAGTVVFT